MICRGLLKYSGFREFPQEYRAADLPHARQRQDILGTRDLLEEFLHLALQELTPGIGSLDLVEVHREPCAVGPPDCGESRAFGCSLNDLFRLLPYVALLSSTLRKQGYDGSNACTAHILGERIGLEEGPETLRLHGPEELP